MAAEAETLDELLLGTFGDERLDRVGRDLLTDMINKRTVNVRRLGGHRSQEVRFGRFLHNGDVTMEATLARGRGTSRASRARARRFGDTGHDRNQLCRSRQKKARFRQGRQWRGYRAISASTACLEAATGGILGLAGCQILNRRRRPQLPAIKRPLAKKESRRWLEGARQAGLALKRRRR